VKGDCGILRVRPSPIALPRPCGLVCASLDVHIRPSLMEGTEDVEEQLTAIYAKFNYIDDWEVCYRQCY
jgi:hypothetical protein